MILSPVNIGVGAVAVVALMLPITEIALWRERRKIERRLRRDAACAHHARLAADLAQAILAARRRKQKTSHLEAALRDVRREQLLAETGGETSMPPNTANHFAKP